MLRHVHHLQYLYLLFGAQLQKETRGSIRSVQCVEANTCSSSQINYSDSTLVSFLSLFLSQNVSNSAYRLSPRDGDSQFEINIGFF